MIIKIDEIRNNFYHGAIYKNRPDETCYEHAIDSEIRSNFEIFIHKYQKTETTISFYGNGFALISVCVLIQTGPDRPGMLDCPKILERARKICYDMNDFISGSRRNTFGRLGCKDWIKFAAIDPLVFYNDYYGKIDANGDGKLQKSEIEESYRRVLEKYPDCPGIGH